MSKAKNRSVGELTTEPNIIWDPENTTIKRKNFKKTPFIFLNLVSISDRIVKNAKNITIPSQEKDGGSIMLFSISGIKL